VYPSFQLPLTVQKSISHKQSEGKTLATRHHVFQQKAELNVVVIRLIHERAFLVDAF